jgi:hypothetical protein
LNQGNKRKNTKNGDKEADIVGIFGETRSVTGCIAFYYHSQYLAGFFGGRWEQRSATASHGETGERVASHLFGDRFECLFYSKTNISFCGLVNLFLASV